jgi:hypothetical protein
MRRLPPHYRSDWLGAAPAPVRCGFALVFLAMIGVQPVPRPAPPASQPELKRVDPAVGDIGPLGVSIRDMGVDLRVPTGFQDVYRIKGRDPRDLRSESGLFVRIDGGIYAVFGRSVYTQTPQGLSVDVPPGTVFYLGGLPTSITGEPVVPLSANYADTSASTRIPDAPPPPPAPPAGAPRRPSTAPVPPGIFTSEPLRARVVRDLLAAAAAAAQRPDVK